MKYLALCSFFALGPLAFGAGVEGIWIGTLEAGPVRLRLVLHVETRANRALHGTLDSLDQSAFNIPLSSISLENGTLRFEIARLGASFEGALAADGSQIAGQFQQRGVTLPLVFHPSGKAPEVRRPQTPQKPYPYEEEEVSFENSGARVRLAGTLTLPRAAGPHPAVLLITGSGPQDRDETIAGHHPFLIIADYLTRRGIAVLRVDDRGFGKSTGKFYDATTQDFAGDALAAVEYLKARREIDPRRIGLVGHSEGGMIAPMLAARGNGVAFIVMLAGPGVTGEQILYEQGYRISKAMGIPGEAALRVRHINEAIYRIVKREPDNAAADKKIRAELETMIRDLPPDQQKAMHAVNAQIEAQLEFATSRWFRAFLVYDPRPALEKVRVPVLALSGERDLQVAPAQNLPAIGAALEAGGNRDYSVVKLPRLNHLFQTCETGLPSEYAKIEETFAPAALEVMGEWIARHTRP